MTFPVSPTDGQSATVNNIVYIYATATGTWTRVPSGFASMSVTGNITGGNVTVSGSVYAGGQRLPNMADVIAYGLSF